MNLGLSGFKAHSFSSTPEVDKLQMVSCPQPVFVNKVLLEHSYAHLLRLCSDWSCGTVTELSRYSRDPMAPQPEVFATWTIAEDVF